jgi:tight adherence protein C
VSPIVLLLIGSACLGVWLIVQRIPTATAPTLRERLLPYLGRPEELWRADVATASVAWLPRWATSLVNALASRLAWATGGDSSVQRRLDALGPEHTVDQFRLEQVLWGAGSALLSAVFLAVRGDVSGRLPTSLLLVVLAFSFGVVARDQALTRTVQRRLDRLRAELPTVIEMLAMAVGAGSSLASGIERVSKVGHGVVAAELSRVLDDTRVGLPLIPALKRMGSRNELNEMGRFVDAVVVAVERGTPLAGVLAAQAADAREAGRRALIEAGGRKEIGMMVPVVFLVLPLSVLFVLFPGFYGLSLGS